MIENDEQEARIVLTCDRCRAQTTIDTASLQIPPLEEATHMGWGAVPPLRPGAGAPARTRAGGRRRWIIGGCRF